jgi:hypothetical protein
MGVLVLTIHSGTACPGRARECGEVHKQLVESLNASAASCLLTDESVLPEASSVCSGGQRADVDRMTKHAAAWELAAKLSCPALIIEDDVSIVDLDSVKKFAQQRKVDCMNLGTRWGVAYMVTAPTAAKLTTYFSRVRRPASITTELHGAIEALCLNSTEHRGLAVDGSSAGTHLPSARADKAHPMASGLKTLDDARDLYETTGHPDVALTYVRMLQERGYAIKAHKVCVETFERVNGAPDAVGTTSFTRAFAELFKGCPKDLQRVTF